MTCPDIDRLIDLVHGDRSDLALRAHVQTCSTCRSELRLLREIPQAFRPDVDVPEELVQRVLADLSQAPPAAGSRVPAVHEVVTGVLAGLTVAFTIVSTGATGSGGLLNLFVFSAAVGATAVFVQRRAGYHSVRLGP